MRKPILPSSLLAGNYKPGRVTATVTDFTVPSAGLSIQIQRTYDSLIKSQSSDFGYGWQLGLNAVNLTVDTVGDVTLTIGGQRHTFYFTPSSTIIPNYYVPQYTAEPGFYGSVSNTGDNCSGVLLAIGNVYQCGINNAGSSYQSSGFKYTDPYGRVYTIGATGALQSLKDLNGNTLTLAASGITSSTGLNIPFVRDTCKAASPKSPTPPATSTNTPTTRTRQPLHGDLPVHRVRPPPTATIPRTPAHQRKRPTRQHRFNRLLSEQPGPIHHRRRRADDELRLQCPGQYHDGHEPRWRHRLNRHRFLRHAADRNRSPRPRQHQHLRSETQSAAQPPPDPAREERPRPTPT